MSFKKKLILNIGHRGFSGKFPENTLLSVSEAVKAGADIVEADLQLTKDNEVVLFHDPTVGRIFRGLNNNNNNTIADFTLKDLQITDCGSWFNSKFSDCKVTTLNEILEYKKHSSREFDFILEIKGNPNLLIPKVKEELKNNNFVFKTGYLSVKDETAFDIAIQEGFNKKIIGLMQKYRSPEELMNLVRTLDVKIVQLRPDNWKEVDWKNFLNMSLKFKIFYADTNEDYEKFIIKNP